MSATDELRRLLDERGVEWSATVGANGTIWTHWDAFNGQRIHAMDNEDGTVEIFDQWDLTPEQAIAATLGPCNDSCNCTNGERMGERMGDELLPCPFCGAKAEVWQDKVRVWGLIEHEPDCWLAYDIPRHKQEIPRAEFAAWNRRADV